METSEMKLPQEFFDWVNTLEQIDSVLDEPQYWFEELPKPCQQALIVEWLEEEKEIHVSVFYTGDGWVYEIYQGVLMYGGVQMRRRPKLEATEAAIIKALELI